MMSDDVREERQSASKVAKDSENKRITLAGRNRVTWDMVHGTDWIQGECMSLTMPTKALKCESNQYPSCFHFIPFECSF